jgi:hypothetical protein
MRYNFQKEIQGGVYDADESEDTCAKGKHDKKSGGKKWKN